MLGDAVRAALDLYPKIFFACHVQHVRDPEARRTLSLHQASILDHLDDVDATSLTDLARHMGVTASTMSLGVDRLVRQGYVTRSKDPVDGRRIGLRLTRAGSRIKRRDKVLDPELVRGMLAHLSPGERREAIGGLELLARAAQESMHAKHVAAAGWRRGATSPTKRSSP